MGTAIIVLMLVIICIYAIKSYTKKLAHGCCGAGGDDEKKIRVKDKNAAHYPYCVKIGVEGMTCSHCKLRVENALNAEDGVWAQVNLKSKSALVRMKDPIPEETLRCIITRNGYTVTDIQSQ
ncbi:copper exporting ATPase [Clostridiales bacterium CHKCI001]|nr:copper exporting ATPase [Clostridiales bacterium CHKCI001]